MRRIAAWVCLLGVPLLVLAGYFWAFYSKEEIMTIDGGLRKYRVHNPRGRKGEKMPLVVALHGYADSPRMMEFYTGWSAKADREKFIVAYPYGTNSATDLKFSWNAGSCCGEGIEKNIDDVTFISRLIDEIAHKYPVDEKRVYLTGFSNGALMAYRILAEDPGKIKAAGIVAGAIGGKRSQDKNFYHIPDPQRPMSVILFHGDGDWAVPYTGGYNKVAGKWSVAEFTAFSEAVDLWSKTNQCGSTPTITIEQKSRREVFTGCAEKTYMEAWTINNRNHVWTGGVLEFAVHGSIRGPAITHEMWRFFENASPN